MKYCSKCGNQVHDEAVICVHCGCSIVSSSPITNTSPSPDKLALLAFVDEVKTIHTLGILSLVLCFGIGLIFQIINIMKMRKYKKNGETVFPNFSLTDVNDIALFERTKKKLITAGIMTAIGYVITIVLIFIIIVQLSIR